MTTTEDWRGVAAEEVEEVDLLVGTRLQARSRKLLRSLVRPRVATGLFALALVIGENLLTLAGPVLIAVAIDTGIPDAVRGDTGVLAACVGGYLVSGIGSARARFAVFQGAGSLVSGIGSAGLRFAFLKVSGRFGQDILLDLRRRVFAHAQRLSLSFHEK